MVQRLQQAYSILLIVCLVIGNAFYFSPNTDTLRQDHASSYIYFDAPIISSPAISNKFAFSFHAIY